MTDRRAGADRIIDDTSALHAILTVRPPGSHHFDVTAAENLDGVMELEITGRRPADVAYLGIALPSTGRDQFWLYVLPDDATDWAQQLLVWIEEEVATGGLGPSRVRVERDGHSHVVAVSYGWQLSDPAEHARLLTAAPAAGWFNGGTDDRA